MSILIEFIVSTLISIYLHWALQNEQAAYIVFGIGLLLSLATYLIREEIATAQHKLAHLYQGSQEITAVLAVIKNPDCQAKAQELLLGFKENLRLLEQGYLLLNEVEFYLEGVKALEQTHRYLKAVDPLQVGWDSRGALLNYYQANLQALKRGVQITRIFVISRRDLLDQKVQKILQQQAQDGIEVRVTYREDLQLKNDKNMVCSLDFAIYNNELVTDRDQENGSYFGKKTQQTAEIEKYSRLYALIEHHSHPLTSENLLAQLLPAV